MATLSITKQYSDASILAEADIDAFKTSLETFFNTTKINDDNIADSSINASQKIIDGSITTAKLNDLSITTAKIKADNVTSAKIAANALDSEHYVDGSFDTEHIADSQITSALIVNDAITTAKLNDGAVTPAKFVDLGQQSSGSISYSADPSAKTELGSITITTTGRPVMILIQPDTSSGILAGTIASGTSIYPQISLERDMTGIASTGLLCNTPSSGIITLSAGCMWLHIDAPSAGTYDYTLYALAGPDTTTLTFVGKFVVFEL